MMQTVVETPSYIALAGKLFSAGEREDIVAMVAEDPECGDVMSGTGGFKKVRVPRAGMGRAAGRGLCTSGATTNFLSSSLLFFRRTKRPI
jgi:hypothetical protein